MCRKKNWSDFDIVISVYKHVNKLESSCLKINKPIQFKVVSIWWIKD